MTIFNQNEKKSTWIKKAVLLGVAGVFTVGAAAFAFASPHSTASAAAAMHRQDGGFYHNGSHRGEFSAEQEAAAMAEDFNLNKETLLAYNKDGWRWRDLHRAAFIAYAGQKPLDDVLAAKTTTNTWRDVSASFAITPQARRAAKDKILSARLAAKLSLEADSVQKLLQDGYRPGDIAMAASIGQKADQSVEQVLGMKQINNRWSDVAASLGISQDDFRQCRQNAHFGREGGHDWQHGRHGFEFKDNAAEPQDE